jgi:hypothetical protein
MTCRRLAKANATRGTPNAAFFDQGVEHHKEIEIDGAKIHGVLLLRAQIMSSARCSTDTVPL